MKYRTAAEKPCVVSSQLPGPLFRRLEALAAQRGITLSKVMRELLTKQLERET